MLRRTPSISGLKSCSSELKGSEATNKGDIVGLEPDLMAWSHEEPKKIAKLGNPCHAITQEFSLSCQLIHIKLTIHITEKQLHYKDIIEYELEI